MVLLLALPCGYKDKVKHLPLALPFGEGGGALRRQEGAKNTTRMAGGISFSGIAPIYAYNFYKFSLLT